jgi:ribosome-binding factor A
MISKKIKVKCNFCGKEKEFFPYRIKSSNRLKLFPELIFNIDNGITYCAEFHIKGGLHKEMQKII